MRVPLLLLLGLSGGFSWVAAQSTPPATPEDQVAALIRQALQSPDDRGTWAGLAQGLSNLDSAQGTDVVALDAAVRVADSLAFTADLGAGAESTEAEAVPVAATIAGLKAWVRVSLSRLSQWRPPTTASSTELLAWPMLLVLVLTTWVMWRRGRAAERSGWAFVRLIRTVSRVARGSAPPTSGIVHSKKPRGRKDPKFVALSLMETGMPTNEVARRTGMSQDEVSVLLAIHRGNRLPFGLDVSVPSGRSA